MADIKFFHKILIVIAVFYLISKLSKIKLPKFSFSRKCQNQPSQPVTRCAPQQPARREPVVREVIKYVQVPAPAPAPVAPVYRAPPVTRAAPIQTPMFYYPDTQGGVVETPDYSGTVSFSEDLGTGAEDLSDGCVSLPDGYAKFYG
jgi:hypothetical protein